MLVWNDYDKNRVAIRIIVSPNEEGMLNKDPSTLQSIYHKTIKRIKGSRWNSKLKNGEGWTVPIDKKSEVEDLVMRLNNSMKSPSSFNHETGGKFSNKVPAEESIVNNTADSVSPQKISTNGNEDDDKGNNSIEKGNGVVISQYSEKDITTMKERDNIYPKKESVDIIKKVRKSRKKHTNTSAYHRETSDDENEKNNNIIGAIDDVPFESTSQCLENSTSLSNLLNNEVQIESSSTKDKKKPVWCSKPPTLSELIPYYRSFGVQHDGVNYASDQEDDQHPNDNNSRCSSVSSSDSHEERNKSGNSSSTESSNKSNISYTQYYEDN